MNIYKYAIPASIAATVHVALLSLVPESTPVLIEVPLVTPALPPIPDRPVDPPKDEPKPEDFEKEVRPLAGGPTPPEISETAKLPNREDFTIPIEERPKFPAKDLKIVSRTFGPGDLGQAGDPIMPDIFTVVSLDRVPYAKVQIPPEYPHAMKQTGAGGTVVVEFDVDLTGRVVRAEALSYSDREFAEPAVKAVRKWRFEPGRRDGRAVPFRMTVPIEFSIETER